MVIGCQLPWGANFPRRGAQIRNETLRWLQNFWWMYVAQRKGAQKKLEVKNPGCPYSSGRVRGGINTFHCGRFSNCGELNDFKADLGTDHSQREPEIHGERLWAPVCQTAHRKLGADDRGWAKKKNWQARKSPPTPDPSPTPSQIILLFESWGHNRQL